MIDQIEFGNLHLATIIRSNFDQDGISFCTEDDNPLQLGYMKREKDYQIVPHTHNKVERKIYDTQEVLFIKSGLVRIDFYDQNQIYLFSEKVSRGDVILLANGGHGFKMLEESQIIEVKQGPYVGERDKNRFDNISDQEIKYR